jgi:hypothetical protein
LDSLFRVKGIENHPVYVWVDGFEPKTGPDLKRVASEAVLGVVARFPIYQVNMARKRYLVLDGYINSMDRVMADKPDYILYLQDDLIIRSDALNYLSEVTVRYKAFIYSLFEPFYVNGATWQGQKRYRPGEFNSWGYLIPRESYRFLRQQITAMTYGGSAWGSPIHNKARLDVVDNQEWLSQMDDTAIGIISETNKLMRISPDKNYTAHFGVVGGAHVVYGVGGLGRQAVSEDKLEFESKMFDGDAVDWLPRILGILREGAYPENIRLAPRGFVYE